LLAKFNDKRRLMKRNSKLNLKGDTDMAKRTSTASAVLVLSLVAFGGAALAASAEDDSFNKVSAGLYEKAKQEGSVIIYSVWDVEHLVKITEAFSKRFPGIKTSYWQARNPEIVTRVVIEFQAKNQASTPSFPITLHRSSERRAPSCPMKRYRKIS